MDKITHLILTRFNLRLWPKDKTGTIIDRDKWLVDRMTLFEKYCLPSVARQTCKEFQWVMLIDSKTPEWCLEKLQDCKDTCPQLNLVKVDAEHARHFAGIFREVAIKALQASGAKRLITTYLDNDDAISNTFIQNVQDAANGTKTGTIISFSEGYQYFTELQIAVRIPYPNNHFISLVEDGESPRTVYGLGSHYYVKGSAVKAIMSPEWVEVIHEGNVDNDVKMTLRTRLQRDEASFMEQFGQAFAFAEQPGRVMRKKWLPRALKQVSRRLGYKIKGRNWWN